VLRGGSWSPTAFYCRSAYRYSYAPATRLLNLGFRVVCESERIGGTGTELSERLNSFCCGKTRLAGLSPFAPRKQREPAATFAERKATEDFPQQKLNTTGSW
jgi:hypothetical protein